MMVTINITQDHINKYSHDAGDAWNCPVFHAFQDAGIKIEYVPFSYVYLVDNSENSPKNWKEALEATDVHYFWSEIDSDIEMIRLPDEILDFQENLIYERPVSPISFVVDIPERFIKSTVGIVD